MILSAILLVGMSLCFSFRPDVCAALTLWPVWSWAVPGLALAFLGLRLRARGALRLVLLWIVYLAVFAEEPRSLIRLVTPTAGTGVDPDATGRVVRVVSLNCAGGNPDAASEVELCHPDIVLLQESPPREAVENLGRRLYGPGAKVVWGIDGSVLARGDVEPSALTERASLLMTRALVRLESGINIEVSSVRLVPPVIRLDLWSPACWTEHAENCRERREQMQLIVKQLKGGQSELPTIIGGDFNASAGDAVFRVLRPRLHDTFSQGGRGWGNTVLNDTPLLRFDQVWTSKDIQCISVTAKKTLHSDHRMVVCDLLIR